MHRSRFLAAIAVAAMLVAAGCGGGGGDSGGGGDNSGGGSAEDNALTIWTTEDVADRVTAQQKIMEAWAQKNGATVKLVAVAADQLTTVLTSAAAANDLPDAIAALDLNGMNQLRTDDLVDPDAAKEVVDGLGADTFFKRTLELTSVDGEQIAVPSDGFSNLLFYRKDLFQAAGLAEPKTYADIQNAAKELKKGKTAGIVAATAPADSFTSQTFEWVALANGCQLVDDSGNITLNSPQCQEAFNFYGPMLKQSSVAGNQDADTTRATYFAGDAAMVIWSSFLLDELAGLRNDALPTCPQCKKDPQWLAKNTGILTQMQGPSGPNPAAWGEVVSWNILKDASPRTKDLVTYMMSDGYLPWLEIAPEGKMPARSGTSANPKEYADGWIKLTAGVDKKEPLTDIYPAEVLNTIVASSGNFERWGIPQGQGELAAAVANQYVVPQAL
ncbi:MAG TPA: extracellular solute-binding protein, partial [Propionibacteriaceae bacterium]|nr:extracellular solute-binding protein [Propionibacteriaceae bacterium]